MRFVALAVALALAGCANSPPPPDLSMLEDRTNAVLSRHQGALRDAPPETRDLVDDLLCTNYAIAEVAEAYGCGEAK